jgi:ubiquinol-cytochrome c reductase iron-sulfur subunit
MDNHEERCEIAPPERIRARSNAADFLVRSAARRLWRRFPDGARFALIVRPGGENHWGEHLSGAAVENPNRRDFLFIATGAVGAVGVGAVAWPLIDQMNPDASTLALASIEVDIGAIAEGQIVTVKWRGGPVFIRHRTKKEIDDAVNTPLSDLKDPQTDQARVQKPEWLIVVGVCTHLGCVPLGHEGPYDGWKCPCHGSIYDTSGRIRQGPAPLNLAVPAYAFLSDAKVKIG